MEARTMRVIKWEPFRDMDDVFNRFFADTLRRFPMQSGAAGSTDGGQQAREWAPLADVSENDGEYVIKAEVPEVRKEDVSVTVQDGVLTLSGERKQEQREENERVHRIERFHGTFARRFALPENADEQGIRAECRDGVIVIRIPKQKQVEQQPRQIQIQ
jgi:HSP20 family protein